MSMIFDETNLETVAGIVARLNSHARGIDLMQYMRQMAERELANRCTYCGTLGFMLTSFRPDFDRDNVHIKASIDPCAFHGIDIKVKQV